LSVIEFPRAWDTSCKDWRRRLLAGESLVPKLPLFENEAARAMRVFGRLRLPDVVGNPRLGDVGGDWLLDIVEALFGSYQASVNKRHISELFLLVPKKNGKSTAAAGMMVSAILLNRSPEAEYLFIAPTVEIASISFRQARGMIRLDETLSALFHIQDNIRRITHRKSGSFLKIIAADTEVVTGSKAVGTLIDETHEFSRKSRAADIFIEVRGALAARPEGFLIQITTQSKSRPEGVFKAELARARDVRDGLLKLPKPLLPVLYELPPEIAEDGGWKDEDTWPLVNPNLKTPTRGFVDPEFLRSSLMDAERKGPTEIALFASQHFNVEIGAAFKDDGWAGYQFWERQADKSLTLDEVIERSETIVIGCDGGGLYDLFGLVVLGRDKKSKDWLAWCHAWCHEIIFDKLKEVSQLLRDFQNAGELTVVSDKLEDIAQIVAIIQRIKKKNKLSAVACDPAGIGDLVTALAEIGVTPENKKLLGAPQGYGMMNAIKMTERRLANGTLYHNGAGVAEYCCRNIRIEPTATAIRATRMNAQTEKIDVIMALFDAATVMWEVGKMPDYQIAFA